MTSFRRSRALAFVAGLTLTSAGAAPIGNNPGLVQVIESPPTFGSCPSPISTMTTVESDSAGADLTLSNTSTKKSQDALIIDVIVHGQRRLFWTPVALRPGSAVAVQVRYLTPVEAPIIILCGDHPVGIVDDPEPVVAVRQNDPSGP